MSENERLKEIRKSLDLTQREFSDALDIKQGSYSDVERGKAGISAVLLKNLIRRFRINPLWLCEGEGDMFIESPEGLQQENQRMAIVQKIKHSSKGADSENSNEVVELIKQLEQQQENLENIRSIIDFLK